MGRGWHTLFFHPVVDEAGRAREARVVGRHNLDHFHEKVVHLQRRLQARHGTESKGHRAQGNESNGCEPNNTRAAVHSEREKCTHSASTYSASQKPWSDIQSSGEGGNAYCSVSTSPEQSARSQRATRRKFSKISGTRYLLQNKHDDHTWIQETHKNALAGVYTRITPHTSDFFMNAPLGGRTGAPRSLTTRSRGGGLAKRSPAGGWLRGARPPPPLPPPPPGPPPRARRAASSRILALFGGQQRGVNNKKKK